MEKKHCANTKNTVAVSCVHYHLAVGTVGSIRRRTIVPAKITNTTYIQNTVHTIQGVLTKYYFPNNKYKHVQTAANF